MTPKEFLAEMKKIRKSQKFNLHDAHVQMDALMIRCLESLGYGEGIKIFDAQEKWYE